MSAAPTEGGRDRRTPPRDGGVLMPTISLGRLAGVPVGLNWTWIVIFGLIVWSLAAVQFPSQAPGRAGAVYVLMAVLTAVAFFGSLLLHELGHALRARRDGVRIDGITLWLFGGVARMGGDYPDAGAELRIAGAGPLVSLGLGVAFTVAGLAWPQPGVVAVCLQWLGLVNLALLAFNLLPALPLDGGRILRALLWRRSGNFVRATARAARIGSVVAALLIGAGVLEVLAGSISGLWLAVIGWFVLEAGRAENRDAGVHAALGGIAVSDLMTRDPITLPSEATLDQVAGTIRGTARHTSYPVLDRSGCPVGLLQLRALAEVPPGEWPTATAGRIALAADEVPAFAPETLAVDALDQLVRSRAGRGIVTTHGRVVGILSMTDLLRALALGRPL